MKERTIAYEAALITTKALARREPLTYEDIANQAVGKVVDACAAGELPELFNSWTEDPESQPADAMIIEGESGDLEVDPQLRTEARESLARHLRAKHYGIESVASWAMLGDYARERWYRVADAALEMFSATGAAE